MEDMFSIDNTMLINVILGKDYTTEFCQYCNKSLS